MNSLFESAAFDKLCSDVQGCIKCPRMISSQRVLNRSSGSLNADVLFIGEAPGRLGADASGIPFHGDKAGHNFEELLNFVGIDRSRIFVTNAVLCNPRDEQGNNSTPNKVEIHNCASFLEQQIKIINPKIVVTLGAVALESTKRIESHEFNLKDNVRTANKWFGRILIPFYHPGQRAMLHRSFANQRSDYQFLADILKKGSQIKKVNGGAIANDNISIVIKEIVSSLSSVDYFKLHKLYYLIEYNYFKKFNHRLTNAYIVRQKDGPYCTDLHIQKIRKSIPEISIKERNGSLTLSYLNGLFDNDKIEIEAATKSIVSDVILKYGKLSNEEIKTKVYLTAPMRLLLRLEKNDKMNLYNVPIPFDVN